jgi:hypothetical protein
MPDSYRYIRKPENVSMGEILPPIEAVIVRAAMVFRSESEWIINNEKLNIPEGSTLYFRIGSYSNMEQEYERMVNDYALRNKYNVFYVDNKDIMSFQQKFFELQTSMGNKMLEEGKINIDKKLAQVLSIIENQIVEKFESNFVNEIEYSYSNYADTPFYDMSGELIANNMLEIPEVGILYTNYIIKFSEVLSGLINSILKTKNKHYLYEIFRDMDMYTDSLKEKYGEKAFEFEDNYGSKYYYLDIIIKLKLAYKEIDYTKYADSIKTLVGRDLYRYYAPSELMLKKGGLLKNNKAILDKLPVGKLAKGMTISDIAKKHRMKTSEIIPEYRAGIKVEMEHTDDVKIASAIARDHLFEDPKYYAKLKKIEGDNSEIKAIDNKNQSIFEGGGVVVGKSHKEADENGTGEKFIVSSTGQVVELEGGEAVIVAEAMSADDKLDFD